MDQHCFSYKQQTESFPSLPVLQTQNSSKAMNGVILDKKNIQVFSFTWLALFGMPDPLKSVVKKHCFQHIEISLLKHFYILPSIHNFIHLFKNKFLFLIKYCYMQNTSWYKEWTDTKAILQENEKSKKQKQP